MWEALEGDFLLGELHGDGECDICFSQQEIGHRGLVLDSGFEGGKSSNPASSC